MVLASMILVSLEHGDVLSCPSIQYGSRECALFNPCVTQAPWRLFGSIKGPAFLQLNCCFPSFFIVCIKRSITPLADVRIPSAVTVGFME